MKMSITIDKRNERIDKRNILFIFIHIQNIDFEVLNFLSTAENTNCSFLIKGIYQLKINVN